MQIRRIRLEIRDVVLCASVTKKVDFDALDHADRLKHIRESSPRKVLNIFKTAKSLDPIVIDAMLSRNPRIIDQIKRPTAKQVKAVLEHNPKALNKLPSNKRSEELVILAIRPPKKVLHGPRDIKARHTIQNVSALHPNTSFTPRVVHEIINLMSGATPKDFKKLHSVFEKQKRKIPEALTKMVARVKGKI